MFFEDAVLLPVIGRTRVVRQHRCRINDKALLVLDKVVPCGDIQEGIGDIFERDLQVHETEVRTGTGRISRTGRVQRTGSLRLSGAGLIGTGTQTLSVPFAGRSARGISRSVDPV